MTPFLLLPDVLSVPECAKLRKRVDDAVGAEEDDNGDGVYARARVSDPDLSSTMFDRLLALPAARAYLLEAGAQDLSHMWFLTRYPVGGSLHPHVDGTSMQGQRHSVLTLLAYLNDDFGGGATAFLCDDEGTPDKVVPRTGSVLLLRQDVLHAGEPVQRGTKYLLRGDILGQLPHSSWHTVADNNGN
jgi:predicted 2-oxoglutarate/Fe(II)-dependent dioxygenase YbiX